MAVETRFRLKLGPWISRRNDAQSLRGVLRAREHAHHGQGELEDIKDRIDVLEQMNEAILEGLMRKGILGPQEVCDIVNETSGHDIEVAVDG